MGNRAQVIIEDTKKGIYTHWYSYELWQDVVSALREYPELWDYPEPLADAIYGKMRHGDYEPMWSNDEHGDLDFEPITVNCSLRQVGVYVPAWQGYLWIKFEEVVSEP